jgi:hypothetical protein
MRDAYSQAANPARGFLSWKQPKKTFVDTDKQFCGMASETSVLHHSAAEAG